MPRFREEIWQEDFDKEAKRKEQIDISFALAVGRAASKEWRDIQEIVAMPETDTNCFDLAKLIARLTPGVETKRGSGGKSIEVRRLP